MIHDYWRHLNRGADIGVGGDSFVSLVVRCRREDAGCVQNISPPPWTRVHRTHVVRTVVRLEPLMRVKAEDHGFTSTS